MKVHDLEANSLCITIKTVFVIKDNEAPAIEMTQKAENVPNRRSLKKC
jgi:hypothetical protein